MEPHFAKYGYEADIPYDMLAYLAYMDDAKKYSYWLAFYRSQELRKGNKIKEHDVTSNYASAYDKK